VPLPTGAKLNNTWLDVSVTANGTESIHTAAFYGLTGYILGIEDPDTQDTLNDVWDLQVSKEVSAQGALVDMDLHGNPTTATASTAVTEPESQPGYFDLEELLGTDNRGNIEVFKRREMLTFAKNPTAWDPASGGTWVPTDHFTTHLKGGPRVEEMSYLIFGFSAPLMDNRDVSEPVTITEVEWFYLQFLDMFVEDMLKNLIGLTADSGTGSSETIVAFLEYASLEPDGSRLAGVEWNVIAKTTFDVTMPGMQSITTLSTDG
jgi:hypothetical protein